VTAALLVLLLVHESTVSSSRLEIGDRDIRATFTFCLEDLAALARLDLDRNGTVDPDEWRRVLPAIVDYVGRKFRIQNGEDPCASERDGDALPPALSLSEGRAPVTIALRYRSSRPLEGLTLRCTLFDEHGGNPRHISELSGGRSIVFDRDRSEVSGVTGARTRSLGLSLPAIAGAAALSLVLLLRRRLPPSGSPSLLGPRNSAENPPPGTEVDPDRFARLRAGPRSEPPAGSDPGIAPLSREEGLRKGGIAPFRRRGRAEAGP
jgi:hypothetical protein